MRWFNFSILILAACSYQNPVFGVDDSGSAGTAQDAGDPSTEPESGSTALTTPPPTTTAGSLDTTVDPTTAGLDDTGGTSTSGTTIETTMLAAPNTIDPPDSDGTTDATVSDTQMSDTQMSDPGTGTTDMLPDPVCAISAGVLPGTLVKVDGQQPECDGMKYVFKGPVEQNGGFLLTTDYKDCGANQIEMPKVYELGSGWEAMDIDVVCAFTSVYWDKSQPGCHIGAIIVQEAVNNQPGPLVMAASFFPNQSPTPIAPVFKQYKPCECPGDTPDCCGGDPETIAGDYLLEVTPGVLAKPGDTIDFMYNGVAMRFYDLDSYIDPVCLTEPDNVVHHADWIAYRN